MQGGPGCSGLIGFFQEHGPFLIGNVSFYSFFLKFRKGREISKKGFTKIFLIIISSPLFQDGKTLTNNPFAWNQNASIIYLEQPAGVGFSYASSAGGYVTNDNVTAADNLNFLEGWFDEFPQFQSNDFWITGESYAGVYVPTLAYQILTSSNSQLISNFKGISVGNPIMYCNDWQESFFNIQIELYYWHGLVSYAARQQWKAFGYYFFSSFYFEIY